MPTHKISGPVGRLWEKLRACGTSGPEALPRLTLEELLSSCPLDADELLALRRQMDELGVAFRPGPVRYPFISPVLLREVVDAGIDISETGITSIGLPAWAETPLLLGGIETVLQLASSSTFHVRAVLGLGGRPHSILRQRVEEHLLGLLRVTRSPDADGGTNGAALHQLPLGPQTIGALRRAGIFTTDQLRRLTDAELARLRGLGPARLAELKAALPGPASSPAPGEDAALHAEAVSVRPDVAGRPVRALDLPPPLVHRLESAGIATVGQLVGAGETALTSIPRLGPISLARVRAELERYLLSALEDVGQDVPAIVADAQAMSAISTLDHRLLALVALLRSERMRRLILRRYGLDGPPRTLEQVGAELGVSKERVRQLESLALEELRREHAGEAGSITAPLHEALAAVGGVAPISYLEEQLPALYQVESVSTAGATRLLLELEPDHVHLPGRRYALRHAAVAEVEQLDDAVATYLRKWVRPAPVSELTTELAGTRAYPTVVNRFPSFSLAARTRANPLTQVLPTGAVALKEWTRTRLDEAIQALRELGKPSHYVDVAAQVRKLLPPGVPASEEAIHNLLLGEAAFVRVSRGVFGLAEWQDSEPGTARAVAAALEAAGKPLHRDEIAEALALPARIVERCLITRPEFLPVGRGYYRLAGQESPRPAATPRRRTTSAVLRGDGSPGAGACARVRITPATHRTGTLALNSALRPLFPARGEVRVAWREADGIRRTDRLRRGSAHLSGLRRFLQALDVPAGDHVYIEYCPSSEPPYTLHTEAQWRDAAAMETDSPGANPALP